MEDKFKFGKLKENISKMRNDLPRVLANESQNFFSKSFTDQGWEGKSWQQVKRRIPGTPEYKYPKKKDLGRRRRPILVGKGSTKLRRAVANSIRVTSWPIVRLIVDLPYARRHNEGLDNMPKRKFMGESNRLKQKHLATIKKFIRNLWQE
jgi:hypothetical protein